MSTTKMLKDFLSKKGAFTNKLNPLLERGLQCISGEVPYRLKLAITVSEFVTFTSHLRKNIILHDGTLVPCNAIVFALSGSGTAKDSSMAMVRKALKPGYAIINKRRVDEAQSKAEKMALLDGKQKEEWLSYYEKPKDLQAGLGSPEGVVKHFHELETGVLGAGSLNASEIGSELLSNKDMSEIIKTIAVGYDLGIIPAKIIKSSENQTDAINCLPISALLFGSQEAILYDGAIKSKFKTMFTTQLARRGIFSFTPEEVLPPQFDTPEEVFAYRNEERERTLDAQQMMAETSEYIVKHTDQDPLVLDKDAQELFDIYKEYNNTVAKDMSVQYPINKLARKHLQWKALKLSGNYAILDGNDIVTKENYIQAINTIELFSDDLMNFEKELVLEEYEQFSKFCIHNMEDGKFEVGLHQLRKVGYIPTSGNAVTKLKELIHLVGNYDPERIYTLTGNDDTISVEEIIKTETMGVSFIIFED